jgi:hypothetical protein
MAVLIENNAVSRLASSLTTGATSVSVTSGEGAKFPTLSGGDWFPATIIKSDGTFEICRCTARATDVLTITRAQEGTSAKSFSAGDRIELRVTKAAFAEMLQAAKNLSDVGNATTARQNIGAHDANNITQGIIAAARLSGSYTINVTGTLTGNVTGNASTATKLVTARTINGVSFDGTANITVTDDTKVSLSGSTLTGHLIHEADNYGAAWARGFRYDDAGVMQGGIGGYGPAGGLTNLYMGLGTSPWTTGSGIRVSSANMAIDHATVNITGRFSPQSTNNRSAGMYGAYDPAKIGHIWSMGPTYTIPDDGANFGNTYGLAYKHTTNPSGGTMAGGHQIVVCLAGTPGVAFGMAGNVWTSGTYTANLITISGSTNQMGIANAFGTTLIGALSGTYSHYTAVGSHHYFYGQITCAGNITAYSDIRVKANIQPIGDALNKVCQLNGATFDRIDADMPRQTGLIAQDVEKVLPEAIHTDPETGHLHVAYGNLAGLFVEAIKELRAEVASLQAEVTALRGEG